MRPFPELLRKTAWAVYSLMVGFFLLAVPSVFAQAGGISIGDAMPEATRSLDNATGASTSLASAAGSQGTVVVFWSNQSPWIDRYEDRVLQHAQAFEGQGIAFVLVNSNDPTAHPEESVARMSQRADARDYPMPYLVDQRSRLARAFGASRTPHVFVFDEDRTLVYMGGIDDSPTEPGQVQEPYLRNALEALLAGAPVDPAETRAFGSTIKFYGDR